MNEPSSCSFISNATVDSLSIQTTDDSNNNITSQIQGGYQIQYNDVLLDPWHGFRSESHVNQDTYITYDRRYTNTMLDSNHGWHPPGTWKNLGQVYYATIDLGDIYNVSGFVTRPAPGNYQYRGRVTRYLIEYSEYDNDSSYNFITTTTTNDDGTDTTTNYKFPGHTNDSLGTSGDDVEKVNMLKDLKDENGNRIIDIDSDTVKARYVRFYISDGTATSFNPRWPFLRCGVYVNVPFILETYDPPENDRSYNGSNWINVPVVASTPELSGLSSLEYSSFSEMNDLLLNYPEKCHIAEESKCRLRSIYQSSTDLLVEQLFTSGSNSRTSAFLQSHINHSSLLESRISSYLSENFDSLAKLIYR